MNKLSNVSASTDPRDCTALSRKKCLSSVLCFLILFNVLAPTVNEVELAREWFSDSPPVVGS